MHGRRLLIAVALFILGINPLHAWEGKEHLQIGRAAYRNACNMLLTTERVSGDSTLSLGAMSHAGRSEKLRLACKQVTNWPDGTYDPSQYAYEQLFGEWSALAADHTTKPSQLTAIKLGDIVADYRVLTRIAVTNYRHFHPASVSSWRENHQKSMHAAEDSAAVEGIAIVEAFENALAIEAFAQHYLQDSFASGHMGFNRVASSNAASLVVHDRGSQNGRCVANLDGTVWFTFGDGRLNDSAEGRRHVEEAATLSVLEFLERFVGLASDAPRWEEVWAKLPAFMKETGSDDQTGCEYAGEFVMLRGVGRPAETAVTWDFMLVADNTVYYGKPVMRAFMIGASYDFAWTIPIGYRVIQNRVMFAVGRSNSEIGPHAWLFDVQYLWHVGTSADGTVTHEIGFGEADYWIPHRFENATLRAIYSANIEFGRVYVRLQPALSRSAFRWGYRFTIGVGIVRRANRN